MSQTSGMRDRDRVIDLNWSRPGRCVVCGKGRGDILYGLAGHQNFFALLCQECSDKVDARIETMRCEK